MKKEAKKLKPVKCYKAAELRKSKNDIISKSVDGFADNVDCWCNPDDVGFEPGESKPIEPKPKAKTVERDVTDEV